MYNLMIKKKVNDWYYGKIQYTHILTCMYILTETKQCYFFKAPPPDPTLSLVLVYKSSQYLLLFVYYNILGILAFYFCYLLLHLSTEILRCLDPFRPCKICLRGQKSGPSGLNIFLILRSGVHSSVD